MRKDYIATKGAFTLAEVLITLGIIGVVVATTLPALNQHHKKQEYSARIKKFYTSVEQAIKFSELDNGDIENWGRNSSSNLTDDKGNIDYEKNGSTMTEFFMTYLAPYFRYTKITDGKNTVDVDGHKSGSNPKVYLADGSTFELWNGGCADLKFDVNGDNKPNEPGRDIFTFGICIDKNNRKLYCGDENQEFCALVPNHPGTENRTSLRNACIQAPTYCGGLLQYDGWEFKNDYPHRL